jgi:hypothetical protein
LKSGKREREVGVGKRREPERLALQTNKQKFLENL